MFYDLHCKPRLLVDDAGKGLGGFLLLEGELKAVFSTKPGRGVGDRLVEHALRIGARRLSCFDGYLVEWYQRHGFKEVRREPNWQPGQPDLVYMEQP